MKICSQTCVGWNHDGVGALKLIAPAGFEPTHKESESSVLPDYTKEHWRHLVVSPGCAPGLRVSKTPVRTNTPRDNMERVSIRPHWFSILYTWACNIRHTLPVLVAFSGFFYLNPSIKCTSHVVAPLSQNILHSMFISDWKEGVFAEQVFHR